MMIVWLTIGEERGWAYGLRCTVWPVSSDLPNHTRWGWFPSSVFISPADEAAGMPPGPADEAAGPIDVVVTEISPAGMPGGPADEAAGPINVVIN